ncbi:MAG: head-tail connector protein [Bdellovibrionales bacterium]
MRSLKLITPPAVEPVTLAEAKQQARIDLGDDDAFVTALIVAARQWAEHYTGRAFLAQVWQLWLDDAPGAGDEMAFGVSDLSCADCGYVALARAPLMAVSSVQTFDDNDVATVWNAANYYVDTAHEPGRLALRRGAVWPVPTRAVNGLMIQYMAGYGAEAGAVPETIRMAIRQLVAHWYEHRGEASLDAAAMAPLTVRALLDPYRLRSLGGV